MRLRTAIIALFGIIVLSILATHLYFQQQNRSLLLKYVSDEIDGTIVRVSDNISMELEEGRNINIQKVLDRTRATSRFIDSISFSFDKSTIAYSSDRTLKGQRIDGEPYNQGDKSTHDALMQNQNLFLHPITYFDQSGTLQNGYVLISVDKEYLFSHIDRQALEANIATLIFHSLILLAISMLIWRFFVRPIDEIMESIKQAGGMAKDFFIWDFRVLHAKLIDSFWGLKLQKQELEIKLKETKYLDEILRTVADINQILISAQNKDELMQKSCDRLAEFGHYKLVWIGFVRDNKIDIRYHSDDKTGYLQNGLHISLDSNDISSKGPSARSVLENIPIEPSE